MFRIIGVRSYTAAFRGLTLDKMWKPSKKTKILNRCHARSEGRRDNTITTMNMMRLPVFRNLQEKWKCTEICCATLPTCTMTMAARIKSKSSRLAVKSENRCTIAAVFHGLTLTYSKIWWQASLCRPQSQSNNGCFYTDPHDNSKMAEQCRDVILPNCMYMQHPSKKCT